MKPELEQELIKEYPSLFKDVNAPMTQTCMCWGMCCGDGWFPLIEKACYLISQIDPKAYFTQIKEKYGTLRLYLVCNDEARGVAYMAESLSGLLCEDCGTNQEVTCEGSWIRTLCKSCREKKC